MSGRIAIIPGVPRVAAVGGVVLGNSLSITSRRALGGGPTPTPAPTVHLSSAISQNEGDSGTTVYTYTVTRSDPTGAISVPWAFSAGTTSADDFVGGSYPAGGTVDMADGVASNTFSINVQGDTTVESDEDFGVSISAPAGYALGSPSSATGTILNDDTASALPTKVVADGDSITSFTYSYPEKWHAANPAVPYTRLSQGGATMGLPADAGNGDNSLWGRTAAVLADEPSVLTVMIGANGDSLGGLGAGAQTFFDRVMEYVAYMKGQRPGLKVVVLSNTPRQDNSTQSVNDNYNAQAIAIDALYRAAVGDQIEGYVPVAIHPKLVASAPNDASFWGTDKLHPGSAVHDIIAAQYAAVVNAIINGDTGSVPDAFAFTDQANVAAETVITGDPIIVSGMGPTNSAPVTATGGTAAIGQGAFSTTPGNVVNGDAVSPRVTSGTSGTDADVEVDIGGVSDIFTASAVAADPIAFHSFASPISDSATKTHNIAVTMPEAGRPVLITLLNGGVDTVVVKDGSAATVATGTKVQFLNTNEKALWAFDNEILAGSYTFVVTGTVNSTYTLTGYLGYLTNSVGSGASASSKDNTFGYHSSNSLKMAAAVTVPAGGIGVLWAYSQNGYNDIGGNTLVQDFGDLTGFYTFASTSNGLMNNLSGQAGMLGASFT